MVLVHPKSLEGCLVTVLQKDIALLNLSYLRVLTKSSQELQKILEVKKNVVSFLDLKTTTLKVDLKVEEVTQEWIRFSYEKLLPSQMAALRIFLSPKKIGESLYLYQLDNGAYHFKGLNESDLVSNLFGDFVLSFLDSQNMQNQVVIQAIDAYFQMGTLSRQELIEAKPWTKKLKLTPLPEKCLVSVLTEARDIMTNFRPQENKILPVKQRLLRILSDVLYSKPVSLSFPHSSLRL